MTFGNTARRRSPNIEQDFDGLFGIMRSRRFRNGEDTGGEPANYIYAYPPQKEPEVERRISALANRLQGMTPVDADDSAPAILVINLYELAVSIMKANDVFDTAIEQEPDMHGDASEADTDTSGDPGDHPWPTLQEDDFYQALAGMLGPDNDDLRDALRSRYLEAKADREADLVFLTGVGQVYPYIRAHALLNCVQEVVDEHTPVIVFFPGTYEKTASTVSVMRLFDRLESDNYYRAFSLNTALEEEASE
ncbi:DUF1788 domain-containing protein [Bifidobacterium leontopitheci]|uniref:DUF1788 domain-containing protein n=1 Tax=Bifidobacterium leontopitheci TaxID=2650774 RepID=A0A6I1GXW9_9BIFI|nr:DUF1788 domain-containing protein [Bifidobacterium leontopitheci]KAB7791311.1 hypothetical protein F7D09_0264 [Bifidobacterium leontopitheci]